MHLINGDWRVEAVSLLALFRLDHLLRQAANKRGSIRAQLRFKGVRVSLNAQLAVGIDHLKFIELTVMRAGDEQLPDAGFPTQAHGVTTTVPVVELPDDGDALGVWRPHGKPRAGNTIHGIRMGTQRFIRPQMGAFGQQPGIHLF